MKKKTLKKALRKSSQETISAVMGYFGSSIGEERALKCDESKGTFSEEETDGNYISFLKDNCRKSDQKKELGENVVKKISEDLQKQEDMLEKLAVKKIKPLKKRIKCSEEENAALREELSHVERRCEKLEELVNKQSFLITYLYSRGDSGSRSSSGIDELYKDCKQDLKKRRKKANIISNFAVGNYMENKHGKF